MLKRRHKFFVWAVLMILTVGGAWALPACGIEQVSYDAAFGRAAIEGYSGAAGDAVTVEMLKPGYTWAQADSASALETEGMLAYLTQAGTDGSGYYSIQWAAQLGAGTYPVRVYLSLIHI